MALSFGKRSTLATLGGLVIAVAVATVAVTWRPLRTQYLLSRLRADPALLWEMRDAPQDSPAALAVAAFLREPEAATALLEEFIALAIAIDETNVRRRLERPLEYSWLVTFVDPEGRLHMTTYTNRAPPPDWFASGKVSWFGGRRGGGFGTEAGNHAARMRDILELAGEHGLTSITLPKRPGWEFSFVDPETEIRVPRWASPEPVHSRAAGVPFVLLARQTVPDGPWGAPAAGAQVRIRSWKRPGRRSVPEHSELPVILIDVRNVGVDALELVHLGELFTVIIDGEPYRKADPGTVMVGGTALVTVPPGGTHRGMPLVLGPGWRTFDATGSVDDGRALALEPGEHTVEVILGRYEKGKWLDDTTARSNRLTIEVPETAAGEP